jgi:hypothetical protein
MSNVTNRSARYKSVLLILFFCVTVILLSSLVAPGSHSLAASAEGTIYGGSECSDFMNGVAVGFGVGALFGCLWCLGGAVVAKAVALFC